MINYPWYEIIEANEPVLQGDFLRSCPVVVPLTENFGERGRIAGEVFEYDVIVMSQSCDLEQRKIDLVLVCPCWTLSEMEKRSDFFRSKKGKEQLRRGHVPGYHLLKDCEIEKFQQEVLVVDFHNVYSVPFDFLTNFAPTQGDRLRLLPPYREHLSQAFARFFMRVGLPIDIPRFA